MTLPPFAIDPTSQLKIISLEGPDITVTGTFNPKEVSLDKSVPWQKQKKKGPADLEYTGGEPKTMSVELMFDGFESNTSVQDQIGKLHALSDPSTDSNRRPPKVMVIWGTDSGKGANSTPGAFPKFEAVIESVQVKYTMFAPDGTVLRATANLKLKEAANLQVGKPQ